MYTLFLALAASFLGVCLIRKFGSYTLMNGFMSKEEADATFPDWKKRKQDEQA